MGQNVQAGSPSRLLEKAREIALAHHERWDGSGYPHGLKGESIPEVTESDEEEVLGYYTLSALSIALSALPSDLARKLPKHAIPAALIGRLAVSSESQGRGIGKILLTDAIKRTLGVGEEIAVYAMVVDALNAEAEAFYLSFGFAKLGTGTNRLFLPLRSI